MKDNTREKTKKIVVTSVATVIAIVFYALFAQPLAYNAITGNKYSQGYLNDLLSYWGFLSNHYCDLNCDIDHDGECDLNCDTNNDGKCDLNCDTNRNGKCDLNCDTDGDKKCNLSCDTNNDGKCDLNCDDNEDGICDRNCDTNKDGVCDKNCDYDNDRKCDRNCDDNNDDICDRNCDYDNDGKCDKNCDNNKDDKCDYNCYNDKNRCYLNCDYDGDGKCDLNCDINNDGKCDLNCGTNKDTCTKNCDDDGDGVCDRFCDNSSPSSNPVEPQPSDNWNVTFTNATMRSIHGSAREVSRVSYNNTSAFFNIALTQPNDYIEYEFTITNKGNFNAKVDDIKVIKDNDSNDYIDVEIFDIQKEDSLKAGKSMKMKVKISLNEKRTDEILFYNSVTISLDFVQA